MSEHCRESRAVFAGGDGPTVPEVLRDQEPAVTGRKQVVLYSELIAEAILERYTTGESLYRIAQLPEMPSYATLMRWARDNGGFRKGLNSARETRALHFEEEARRAAEDAIHKDDVPAARLKFDAYKWSAEVSDSSRYGKKTTLEGNPDKPLTFIITSGFPDPLPSQMPPTLGPDGLIKKDVNSAENAREVASEVVPVLTHEKDIITLAEENPNADEDHHA